MQAPDLVPLAEALRQFEVGRSTLYAWLRAGKLKRYRRLGDRRTHVDRRELARLLEFRVEE